MRRVIRTYQNTIPKQAANPHAPSHSDAAQAGRPSPGALPAHRAGPDPESARALAQPFQRGAAVNALALLVVQRQSAQM